MVKSSSFGDRVHKEDCHENKWSDVKRKYVQKYSSYNAFRRR